MTHTFKTVGAILGALALAFPPGLGARSVVSLRDAEPARPSLERLYAEARDSEREEAASADGNQTAGWTLYITAKTAGLYVDPKSMEDMPGGFSAEDLERHEIAYRLFGKDKTVEAVRGAELTAGERVVWGGVESADGDWLAVDYHGLSAWMRRSELTGASWPNYDPAITEVFKTLRLPEGTGFAGVVELAKSRLGDAYVWGGSSPGSFDCSGLMQWAYRMHGIQIPRVSRDQKAAARPISPGELQPGDLVFTGNPVKHVMMYAGDGRLVEAMGRRWGVVMSNLSQRTANAGAVHYGTFRGSAGQ